MLLIAISSEVHFSICLSLEGSCLILLLISLLRHVKLLCLCAILTLVPAFGEEVAIDATVIAKLFLFAMSSYMTIALALKALYLISLGSQKGRIF